jgi:hypothetical protein
MNSNIFHFPESCCVDQRIGKALFAENGPLTPGDRKTFRSDIEEIFCSYILDDNHGVMLNSYTDAEHDFSCLAQIDVVLRKPGKAARVAELCHRAMPYPLIVILHDGDKLWFSMAEKRFSRDGKEQVVLEQQTDTGWIGNRFLQEFSAAADFSKFKKSTYLDLYRHYVALLDVLKTAELTGTFQQNSISPEERRQLLEELHQLQNQLVGLKAKAKKEAELSRLVEINMQAKKLNHEIHEIHEKLK